MQKTVFYEDWQMDCCGEPFSVGDKVDWVCVKNDFDKMLECDYYYEAHGDEKFQPHQIKGQVIQIDKIDFQYEFKDGVYVPISYDKKAIEKATEFMFERGGGFLVLLDDVMINS